MTKVIIKETKETAELEIIDPKTGLDWSNDLLSNYDAGTWLGSGEVSMSRADYDWWYKLMDRYEKADTEAYEFFEGLELNIIDCESAGSKYSEMKDYFEEQKMVRGGDLEDEPQAILDALRDTKEAFEGFFK